MARDHFIPQFYLRHFEIPNRPKYIYSYKHGLKPKARAIKGLACADNYYTLTGDDLLVSPAMPDEFLSMSEDAAAPILKKLLDVPSLSLSEGEKIILSLFIAHLSLRTPVARARAINVHKAMYLRKIQWAAQREDFVDVVMNKLKLTDSVETAETWRRMFLNPEKNFIAEMFGPVDNFSLERSFKTAGLLTDILLNLKHWILVEAPAKTLFVTSDNPFVVLAPEPYMFTPHLNPANAECILPISPKRAILFSNRIKGSSLYRPAKSRMHSWVKQIVSFGYESVFASVVSAEVQQMFDRVPAGKITEVPVWTIPAPPLKKRKTNPRDAS